MGEGAGKIPSWSLAAEDERNKYRKVVIDQKNVPTCGTLLPDNLTTRWRDSD